MSEKLTEALSFESTGIEGRLIKGVALVGPTSKNGYRYTEAALSGAAAKYEGKPVYLDHATDPRTNRSTRDLAGSISSARFEDGRVFGDVKTLATDAGRTLLGLAEDRISGVGMSHVVEAVMSKDRKTVESIADVLSVDAVSRPATTKSFFEEERPIMDLKTLKESHPDLVKAIEKEAADAALALTAEESRKDVARTAALKVVHDREMAEAVKAAKSEAIKEESKRQSDIRALCETAKLPDLADAMCSEQAVDVAEAQRRLFAELCKRNPAPSAGGKPVGESQDENAAYVKEFTDANLAESLGLTQEQYVNSRRKDDGKQPLPKAAK